MGSIDTFHVEEEEEEEFRVLVTGFGPFKDQYPINPSWEIASSLPEYLPWDRAKDPDPSHRSSAHLPRVHIEVHPSPVRVNYEVVRRLVPTLWDNPGHRIDLMLHIGMAGPPIVYSIERRGHRDGYRMKDVDGRLLHDDERREREGDDWIWHGVPHELKTELDIEDIYRRWADRCPKSANLRISDDPGRYLCDFIYFSSLAHLWKQHRPRKVLFLHVPCHGSDEFVKTGTELAVQLIRSMVESEVIRRQSEAEKKATG